MIKMVALSESKGEYKALLDFWIKKRNIARDLRKKHSYVIHFNRKMSFYDHEMFSLYDYDYRECNKRIRELRKIFK